MTEGDGRRFLLDASAAITLAEIAAFELLDGLPGAVAVPDAVADEVRDDPAASTLERAQRSGRIERAADPSAEAIETARQHLGSPVSDGPASGDVALLAGALESAAIVVITDDKPLRRACKALGVPVSGSIGVLIAAVERGDLEPDGAKEALVAMDEVGARLSARLLRRAERHIDEAADRETGANESG